MKKFLLLFFLGLFIVFLKFDSFAELTYEDYVDMANKEIKEMYSIDNYYSKDQNTQGRKLNTNLVIGNWEKIKPYVPTYYNNEIFKAFVYGEQHDFDGTDIGNNHFAGYAMEGMRFPNIYHEYDGWDSSVSMELKNWIRQPWNNASITLIKMYGGENFSKFDIDNQSEKTQAKMLSSIIEGFPTSFEGVSAFLLPESDPRHYTKVNWLDYVHIIQPPTTFSWGIGMMWLPSLGYKSILMSPFERNSDNLYVDLIQATEEAEVNSNIVINSISKAVDYKNAPIDIITTAKWEYRYINGDENDKSIIYINRATNNSFDISDTRLSTISFDMPSEVNKILEIKFSLNYNEDNPYYESAGFEDNYKIVRIKAIAAQNIPSGRISFTPSECDWRNGNINPVSVKVDVIGSTSIYITGRDTRTYTISDYKGNTYTYITLWRYTQEWKIGDILVNGNNLDQSILIQNGQYVTVKKEGFGDLQAKINNWIPGSKSWASGGRGWEASEPRDTNPPNTFYESKSGEYKIDNTNPKLNIDWSNRDFYKNSVNQFIFMPNNTIKFNYSDNLSGISQIRYLWSLSSDEPPVQYMKNSGIETSEYMESSGSQYIKIHEDGEKLNLWYLHFYIVDRAGNEFRFTEPIEIIAYLHNFQIDDNKDPTIEKDVFPIKVKDLPMLSNSKNFYITKKGYEFDFSFQSEGLNQDYDRIIITPKFYYLTGFSKDEIDNSRAIDLYYNLGEELFIKVGDTERDRYKIMANGDSIGGISKLEINTGVRYVQSDKNAIWYANYKILPQTFVAIKGSEIIKNGVLDQNAFLTGGYILVCFDIKAYKGDVFMFTYNPDKWIEEGGATGVLPDLYYPGDIIVFDNSNSLLDDIDSNTNH